MVKKEKGIKNPYDPTIKVGVESVNYLLGKILTHAELLGLGERQYKVFRSTTKDMIWDWYNRHMENKHGFADPSRQARVEAGIEPDSTGTFRVNTEDIVVN